MADATPITKICTACRAEKPLSEFYTAKHGKFGRRSVCRTCHGKRYCVAAGYRPNREKARIAATAARHAVAARICPGCNKERLLSDWPKWTNGRRTRLCAECTEAFRVQAVANLAVDGQKRCSLCAEIKPITAFSPNRHKTDGAQPHCHQCASLKTKRYKYANPEKQAKWHRQRGALLARVADGTLTQPAVATILRSRRACPYCGTKISEATASIDHMVALSLGGAHSALNAIACCLTCNIRKGAKPFTEWLRQLKPVMATRARREYRKRFKCKPEQAVMPLMFGRQGP